MRRLLAAAATVVITSAAFAAPAMAAQDPGPCEFERGTSTCFNFAVVDTFAEELKVGGMESCYIIEPRQRLFVDYSAHRGAPHSNGKALADPYQDETFVVSDMTKQPVAYCLNPNESITLFPR